MVDIKKIPGYLNKLPGFSSTQNVPKIVIYPGIEYSKLLTLTIGLFETSEWGVSQKDSSSDLLNKVLDFFVVANPLFDFSLLDIFIEHNLAVELPFVMCCHNDAAVAPKSVENFADYFQVDAFFLWNAAVLEHDDDAGTLVSIRWQAYSSFCTM